MKLVKSDTTFKVNLKGEEAEWITRLCIEQHVHQKSIALKALRLYRKVLAVKAAKEAGK